MDSLFQRHLQREKVNYLLLNLSELTDFHLHPSTHQKQTNKKAPPTKKKTLDKRSQEANQLTLLFGNRPSKRHTSSLVLKSKGSVKPCPFFPMCLLHQNCSLLYGQFQSPGCYLSQAKCKFTDQCLLCLPESNTWQSSHIYEMLSSFWKVLCFPLPLFIPQVLKACAFTQADLFFLCRPSSVLIME